MAHNGKRGQINLDVTHLDTTYPFLNHFKANQGWVCVDVTTRTDPTKHNANGYMSTLYGDGVTAQCIIPTQAQRPGNYVLKCTGGYTLAIFSDYTGVSGSLTGTNPRYVFTPDAGVAALNIAVTAISAAVDNMNIVVCHVDDEAALDAGGYFQTAFLTEVAKFGVIRFVNCFASTTSDMVSSSDLTPLTYNSWCLPTRLDSSKWAGATVNSSDDYTATLTGFVLADKARIYCRFNASASSNRWRMRVETSTGVFTSYYPIMDKAGCLRCDGSGAPLYKPTINVNSVLVFDDTLQCWIMSGGSTYGAYGLGDKGMESGWPIEVVTALCNQLGLHPWINIPYLALDPLSDLTAYIATYFLANLSSGLVPRFEPANEVWPSAFPVTQYANAKETARTAASWKGAWVSGTAYVAGDGVTHKDGSYIVKVGQNHTAGSTNEPNTGASYATYWTLQQDYDEWYGRAFAKMGTAVGAVYGGDTSRYKTMLGVWTFQAVSTGTTRANAARYVSEGGVTAKSVMTDVAPAHYWYAELDEQTYNSTVDDLADEYVAATDARKLEILEEFMTTSGSQILSLTRAKSDMLKWWNWAAALSPAKGLEPYEGGYSADRTGVHGFPATANIYTLRIASYNSNAAKWMTYQLYQYIISLGGKNPSQYLLAADNSWAPIYPTIYNTKTAVLTAENNFANEIVGFRATTSVS